MIYGAVLAGGIGSRMKIADMPKQFLMLGKKPIIIHTVEKFSLNERFDYIYVGVNKDWKQYFIDLMEKYGLNDERIIVVEGGTDRTSTIMNIVDHISETNGIHDEDVIITHDAVRPFLTNRIINDNIDVALQYGMADTVIPSTDTIVESLDGAVISSIPERKRMYNGQTPQSFNIKLLIKTFSELTKEQVAALTDACRIFTFRGLGVHIVQGEIYNIKITTVSDYKIAKAIVEADFID